MQYSLVENKNEVEMSKVKNFVNLSLQSDLKESQNFDTINSINVPVNQQIPWEFTRFKEKGRVYKNPNLSAIHLKSALENKKSRKKRKSRPVKNTYKEGVGQKTNPSFSVNSETRISLKLRRKKKPFQILKKRIDPWLFEKTKTARPVLRHWFDRIPECGVLNRVEARSTSPC